MSPVTRLLCLLLIYWCPWYCTRFENDLLVRFDLNEQVWQVALGGRLAMCTDTPMWALASTDPRASDDPYGLSTYRRVHVYTLRERSGMTLNAIRQAAKTIR